MEVPKLESLNKNTLREKYISIHYPEFHTYIIEHYPTDLAWTEKLHWYYHNINDYPKCPNCGHHTTFMNFTKGYYEFCSTKCMRNSERVKEKTKQTNLLRYGYENAFKNKDLQEKQKQTLLKNYEVEHPLQNKIILNKQKQTCLNKYGYENAFKNKDLQEKQKQTCLDKYGVVNISQNDNIKEKKKLTTLFHYGVDNPNKSKEIQEKSYNTKKSNNTFNSSKIEKQFKQWLDDNRIKYKTQYRSDEYPFACDFYFPEKDLYLEIQGSWTHGDHPYNPNNESDKIILEEMQNKHTEYYNNAIRVWTVTDPLKRETANKNGLNWVEVFSCKLDDIVDAYNSL